MKKIFLVAICIFSFVLVQNFVLAQEVVPSAELENSQRTQFELKTETSDSDLPANLVTAPIPENVKNVPVIADNADFTKYMSYVQRRVRRKWYPQNGTENQHATVTFSIAKSGKLFNVKVLDSAEDIHFNNAALIAVNNAEPLLPLPADVDSNYIDMQFTFDSNTFGNNCHCISYYNTGAGNVKNVSNGSSSSAVYTNYQKRVDEIIYYNVPQKQYFFPKNVAISLEVDKSGNVKYISLEKSSRSEHYDDSVIKAVRTCVFPPIPDSLNTDRLVMNYNLVSSPYSPKNKNIFKIAYSEFARCLTILMTGH